MNEYIEALKLAIESNGKESKFTVSNLDGSNSHETTMIEEKQGTVGAYQVVWHNRWCFYYKGEMIAQYSENRYNDYVQMGNQISKVLSKRLYPMIIESVKSVLGVNVHDSILVA